MDPSEGQSRKRRSFCHSVKNIVHDNITHNIKNYKLPEIRLQIPDDFKVYFDDFWNIYTFAIMSYSRNTFRYNSTFSPKFTRSPFDYDFANKNMTIHGILAMQEELIQYKNSLQKNPTDKLVQSYVDFIRNSMKLLIEDIIVPIEIIPENVSLIIEKYTKKKKSRINKKALQILEEQLKIN